MDGAFDRAVSAPPTAASAAPAPAPLSYEPPRHRAGWNPVERQRCAVLLAIVSGAPVLAGVWSFVGVQWGQWREGSIALFQPATGTDFYETWFASGPIWAVTGIYIAVAGVTLVKLIMGRWRLEWIWIISLCWIAWLAYLTLAVIALDGPFP